jgi:hypothetical protein
MAQGSEAFYKGKIPIRFVGDRNPDAGGFVRGIVQVSG